MRYAHQQVGVGRSSDFANKSALQPFQHVDMCIRFGHVLSVSKGASQKISYSKRGSSYKPAAVCESATTSTPNQPTHMLRQVTIDVGLAFHLKPRTTDLPVAAIRSPSEGSSTRRLAKRGTSVTAAVTQAHGRGCRFLRVAEPSNSRKNG